MLTPQKRERTIAASLQVPPMNVRVVAAFLFADKELEEIERAMKRKQDWRSARKITNLRAHLAQAMEHQQESLQTVFAEFQDRATIDQALRS